MPYCLVPRDLLCSALLCTTSNYNELASSRGLYRLCNLLGPVDRYDANDYTVHPSPLLSPSHFAALRFFRWSRKCVVSEPSSTLIGFDMLDHPM